MDITVNVVRCTLGLSVLRSLTASRVEEHRVQNHYTTNISSFPPTTYIRLTKCPRRQLPRRTMVDNKSARYESDRHAAADDSCWSSNKSVRDLSWRAESQMDWNEDARGTEEWRGEGGGEISTPFIATSNRQSGLRIPLLQPRHTSASWIRCSTKSTSPPPPTLAALPTPRPLPSSDLKKPPRSFFTKPSPDPPDVSLNKPWAGCGN